MTRGSSSPSGLRVCTSSYVFDLSLSLSLSLSRVLSRVPSMARSWCIPSFAIVVGSYDVSPPLLSCDELSFPFEVILSDWVFMRTLDVCLAVIMCGDNGISCATWCMFWWSTCGFRDIGNLCIGVGTRSWLSGSSFGALFEVLLCWLDESEIVWRISYNHAHGYLRWQWSI